jgi:hypothetical protein
MFSKQEYNIKYQHEHRIKYPWYKSYHDAKQRCTNPNNPRYCNYGSKGIKFLITEEQIKALVKEVAEEIAA